MGLVDCFSYISRPIWGVSRGDPTGGVQETPAAGGNEGENLASLGFSGTSAHPVVESGREWVKVVESGRKRGEAKTTGNHPGWFFAPTEGLGLSTRSTWAPS